MMGVSTNVDKTTQTLLVVVEYQLAMCSIVATVVYV